MKKKRVILIILLTITTVILGTIILSLNIYNKNKKLPKNTKSASQINAVTVLDENGTQNTVVSKESHFIFKTFYKKSGEVKQDKVIDPTNKQVGKNRKYIESLYSKEGYVVSFMDKSNVILTRTFDRYSPDKYVLDLYLPENCLAIFKTDEEGNEIIESSEKDIKTIRKLSTLKDGDIEALKKGLKDFQFNTRDDAEAYFNEIFNS